MTTDKSAPSGLAARGTKIASAASQLVRDSDRRVAVGLLILAAFGIATLSGPLQSWLAEKERVEQLEVQLDELREANSELRQRASDLRTPTELEVEARRRHGFIRDGEVSFFVEGLDEPGDPLRRDVTDKPDDVEGAAAIATDDVWLVRALRAAGQTL